MFHHAGAEDSRVRADLSEERAIAAAIAIVFVIGLLGFILPSSVRENMGENFANTQAVQLDAFTSK